MRPQAIPLAMLTTKKETLGFHNFYAWLSSVSPVSIGMGLCYDWLPNTCTLYCLFVIGNRKCWFESSFGRGTKTAENF